MSDEPTQPPKSRASLDVNVQGQRDVSVGDVAGRDVVKTTTTAGRDVVGRDVVSTTNVGFSATAVQRLLLTVGALVFATAACFFSGGLALGAGVFVALNRPVTSDNPVAAQSFAIKLALLKALGPGQPFSFPFTEEEISSYFRQIIAPQIGVLDGKVRLLDEPGKLVVAGQATQFGNLPFAATFELRDTPGESLHLTGVVVQIIPLKDKEGKSSSFGWVVLPSFLFQGLAGDLNSLFGNVQLSTVAETATAPNPAWVVDGVTR